MSDEKEYKVTDHRPDFDEEPKGDKESCCEPTKEEKEAATAAEKAAASVSGLYPKVTFSTFILSMSSSCLVHLGEVPEPETGQYHKDPALAKHTIDIIAMLKDKSCKCLDEDERRLIEGVLYELRMKFVMLQK